MSDSQPAGNESKTKVVVVEDHPMFRERLVQVIQAGAGMTVCGEAESVADAIEVIRTTNPDVAIVDISLRGSSGLDLIKQLKASHINIPVLVLSMHDETAYAEKSLHAGARGYLMKHAVANEVVSAIKKVLGGDIFLSDTMMERVIQWAAEGTAVSLESGVLALSEREVQVFESIGRGRNVKEIAVEMNLGETTVHTYRARIKEKLGLRNGNELSVCASRWVNELKGGGGREGKAAATGGGE